MNTTKAAPARFRVGDWITFLYGTRKVLAQIAEDRGPLGVRQRRLYRISLEYEDTEPDSFELPEESLEAVAPPSKGQILQYLKEGGLVALLQSHLVGRADPPKVWLTWSSRGELTPVFHPQRGLVGGASVPYFALYEDKVLLSKKNEVLSFLAKFDLTQEEAEEVVAAVGTGP